MTIKEGVKKVADVSPKLNSPDRPKGLPTEDANRLIDAASGLKQAIDDLAETMVSGGIIRRDDARDRFEIALAEFSELIDRTRE
ncbi:MAG: hypothetical protein QOF33_3625 [Thermomicrobiales bacterium]|nr:hypothetical protein [Thermomicrobiales bacterium]MEA2598588.1 hypothetical protein [Thermomicrobiales bacterium]